MRRRRGIDWLAGRGARTLGFDASPAMVAECRRRCGPSAVVLVADLSRPLPLAEASVDGITQRFWRHPPAVAVDAFADAGFVVERVAEPRPSEALVARHPELATAPAAVRRVPAAPGHLTSGPLPAAQLSAAIRAGSCRLVPREQPARHRTGATT